MQHYRNFTTADTLLFVGLSLVVFLLVYWFSPSRTKDFLRSWQFLTLTVLVGFVLTYLSTFYYGEPLGSKVDAGLQLHRYGYPRPVYTKEISPGSGWELDLRHGSEMWLLYAVVSAAFIGGVKLIIDSVKA